MTEESMIERVAKAIGRTEVVGDFGRSSIAGLINADVVLAASRAAIEAMREPTDGVLAAAVEDNGSPRDPYDSWRAMIAAALA
jgi:hypothetical protein